MMKFSTNITKILGKIETAMAQLEEIEKEMEDNWTEDLQAKKNKFKSDYDFYSFNLQRILTGKKVQFTRKKASA